MHKYKSVSVKLAFLLFFHIIALQAQQKFSKRQIQQIKSETLKRVTAGRHFSTARLRFSTAGLHLSAARVHFSVAGLDRWMVAYLIFTGRVSAVDFILRCHFLVV